MARQFTVVITVTALLVVLAGCGINNPFHEDRQKGQTVTTQQPSGDEWPCPLSLLKDASTTGGVSVNGSDFNVDWPNQKVTADGTKAIYTPDAGEPPQLADMAYAIYQFDLSSIEPQSELVLDWLTAPAAENLWAAFSDWQNNRWDWYSTSDPTRIALHGISDYINNEGVLLVVLALAGKASATLSCLRILPIVDTWPCVGHDRRLTCQSDYLGPSVDYVQWTYQVVGTNVCLGTPVLSVDGSLYVAVYVNSTDWLYAFTPEGAVKWTCEVNGNIVDSNPAVGADGTVYICSTSPNMLYAINPEGSVDWSREISPCSYPYLVIGKDGTIFIVSRHEIFIHAFRPDGELQWFRDTEHYGASHPALDDNNNIYIGTMGCLSVFNPDGSFKWSMATEGSAESPSIADDGTVYFADVVSWDGVTTLYAVNPDGSLKWDYLLQGLATQCPAISADNLVYLACGNQLYVMNADGTEKWHSRSNTIKTFLALDAAGTAYFGRERYYGAINSAGELVWTHFVTDASTFLRSPAIGSNGWVYVAYGDRIAAFGNVSGSTTVYGMVKDENGEGVAGVVMNFDSSIAPVVTDENGGWTARGVGDGTYTVTPSLAGSTFDPLRRSFTVNGEDCAVAEFTALAATQGDWWCIGRDRQHTRRSPYIGPHTANTKWTYALHAFTISSPVIGSDGTVYIGSNDGVLYAIGSDGVKQWSRSIGTRMIDSAAVGLDGTVYVEHHDGTNAQIFAYNSDGTLKWCYEDCNFGHPSSPAIGQNGELYFSGQPYRVVALSPSGSLLWKCLSASNCICTPAVDNNGLIYAGGEENICAINPDGSISWSYLPVGENIATSPAIGADGTVYLGTSTSSLIALSSSGVHQWEYLTGNAVLSSPALGADGTIYFGCIDTKLYAINPDGSLQWAFETGGEVYSSPAVGADGVIYFGSNDHNVYALNPDGSLLWSYTTGDEVQSSPAIDADGSVYIGSRDCKLYAFRDE